MDLNIILQKSNFVQNAYPNWTHQSGLQSIQLLSQKSSLDTVLSANFMRQVENHVNKNNQ